MARKSISKLAVEAIERRGVLLVFPLENRPEPRSLWSELHPRSAMRWAWDDGFDRRVVELWHLRTELTLGRGVVYAKWFRGRATFFSRPVFEGMLAALGERVTGGEGLTQHARTLLELLDDNSPQATRALRMQADLTGKEAESAYNRAMKDLWSRLLIVGAGEEDEGGFPSLTVASSRLFFEDLWLGAQAPDPARSRALASALEAAPLFRKQLEKTAALLSPPGPRAALAG